MSGFHFCKSPKITNYVGEFYMDTYYFYVLIHCLGDFSYIYIYNIFIYDIYVYRICKYNTYVLYNVFNMYTSNIKCFFISLVRIINV